MNPKKEPAVKVEKITAEEFDKAPKGRRVSQWTKIISDVKETGDPVKVSGLSRGQVAAGYRKAKDEGLQVKANYKDGVLLIAPVTE